MLKIQFKDKRQPSFWVMDTAFSIGSASTNHCTITAPTVSQRHAEIINCDSRFVLKDLNSAHGTFVNGQRITKRDIFCGDIVDIGDVGLEVIDPLEEAQQQSNGKPYWSLIADSSWLNGQEFPIVGNIDEKLTLGRSSQSTIVFPGTHLSRLHAEITINYSSLTLRDMGSANGTFVNGKKIDCTQVYSGDTIRMDVYSFRVCGPGITLSNPDTTPIDTMPSQDHHAQEFKLKPTSPGNREQLNLYKKRYGHLIIAGLIILGIAALATYVGLGVAGII